MSRRVVAGIDHTQLLIKVCKERCWKRKTAGEPFMTSLEGVGGKGEENTSILTLHYSIIL